MLKRIISGGQTGADKGGLIAAHLVGFETGGTAPQGYRTLKGSDYDLRDIFGLSEHISWAYPPRTEDNVRNSDGTIRFASDFNSAGEKCTLRFIKKYGKSHLDIDITNPIPVSDTVQWIKEHNIETLNIAGNSNQTCPGIEELVPVICSLYYE